MTGLAMYFYRKIDEIITQINDYVETKVMWND